MYFFPFKNPPKLATLIFGKLDLTMVYLLISSLRQLIYAIKSAALPIIHIQAVLEIHHSEELKMESEGIGGYDLTDLGKIVTET